MYACKQCGTGNPLDSSFCKKCGAALPEQELAEARLKLGELLEEGNNLFTEGRTDEAMLIAEAAVTANPSSHLAYSLKGLCHERVGQIAEALECYEIAVGLNPDSALDKVKVAALRNRLAQHVAPEPEKNRRGALMLAATACIAVLSLASLAAIGFSSHKSTEKVAMNTPNDGGSQLPMMAGTTGTITSSPPQSSPPPPVANLPAGTTGTTGSVGGIDLPSPPPASVGLPAVGVGDSGSTVLVPDGGGNKPLSPPVPPGGPVVADPQHHGSGVDSPPEPFKPDSPVTNGGGDKPTEKGPDDPGYINIQMAPTHSPALGGSQPVSDGNEVTTVLKAAQELYLVGKYDSAASKYRHVAEMGGDSPHLQQRLGDCYRNLGHTDQARSAYNRAINMYQGQIKQGHDVPANQRGLDACESALKVLGG